MYCVMSFVSATTVVSNMTQGTFKLLCQFTLHSKSVLDPRKFSSCRFSPAWMHIKAVLYTLPFRKRRVPRFPTSGLLVLASKNSPKPCRLMGSMTFMR